MFGAYLEEIVQSNIQITLLTMSSFSYRTLNQQAVNSFVTLFSV
jgi:hypothetical protein